VVLHQVKERSVLLRDGQIENMSCALAKVTVRCRNVLGDESDKIGPSGAMKASAEPQRVPLPSEDETAMVEAIHGPMGRQQPGPVASDLGRRKIGALGADFSLTWIAAGQEGRKACLGWLVDAKATTARTRPTLRLGKRAVTVSSEIPAPGSVDSASACIRPGQKQAP
jgi:hypothetical protein